MEIQLKHPAPLPGPATVQAAPPPPVADTRPTADTAALNRDATPDMPLPPTPTQQALVGQIMVRDSAEAGRSRPDAPVEEAGRTLKPYGIEMLPTPHPDRTTPDHGT